MNDGYWPLVVGPAWLIPAGQTARDDGGTVHLGHAAPGTAVQGAPVATLCGREALSLGIEVDLDVLGSDRDRLCGSCWRIVEGWLEPPTAPFRQCTFRLENERGKQRPYAAPGTTCGPGYRVGSGCLSRAATARRG